MDLIPYQNGINFKLYTIPFCMHTEMVCSATLAAMTSKEIRRINATLLKDEAGGVPAFAKKIKRPYSYCRNITVGDKGIGDAVARDIEKQCAKPRGWLDIDHSKGAVQAVSYDGLSPLSREEAEHIKALRKLPQDVRNYLCQSVQSALTSPPQPVNKPAKKDRNINNIRKPGGGGS